MLKVALTGGMATGKSVVLSRARERGVAAIGADDLVHAALAPGAPATHDILARFGTEVASPEGGVDRRRLGAVVFADAAARRALEAILHPEVYRTIFRWFERLQADGLRLGMAEIPLLFETGRQAEFDRVVVTLCSPEEQVRRIIARDGLSEPDARQRLAAQWPVAEKAARADFVVHTDGTIEETLREADAVIGALMGLGN
jgi:dephospho-CoA kinase